MKNLEGIKIVEMKESELEKKSIDVTDDYSFDDCVLNEEEQSQKFINMTDDYNFDDCILTEKEQLLKLKHNLEKLKTTHNDDYEKCGKIIR